MDIQRIFEKASTAFELLSLETFGRQYLENSNYRSFCKLLGKDISNVKSLQDIPFLPVEFFKTHTIKTGNFNADLIFSSSGTTGQMTSKHHLPDRRIYEWNFRGIFESFYGQAEKYCILALLPSYLEREGSSLVYMCQELINRSRHPHSGFYLNDRKALAEKLRQLDSQGQNVLLIGVSFALLDLVNEYSFNLRHTTIMETGGMKGRKKEMIREELHTILKKGFGVRCIHSEYGMTELLSQAYSAGEGVFRTPPWMRVLIRDPEDPLSYLPMGRTGGINIIDLANQHSCAFLATKDLGKLHADGSFEVIGRFDHSDIRGCNLMAL